VTLAEARALDAFGRAVSAGYARETDREPRITVCAAVDGAGPIR